MPTTNHPKNPPQTEAEMTNEMTTVKRGQRNISKVEADAHKSEQLSALINENSKQLVGACERGKSLLAETEA
jgi:hypothetical protein